MTLTEAVTIRVKKLLDEKKMSRYRLGKITCLDRTTFQAMFKGKTKDVRLSSIRVIAEAFDMSLKEFFDYEVFKYENIDY